MLAGIILYPQDFQTLSQEAEETEICLYSVFSKLDCYRYTG